MNQVRKPWIAFKVLGAGRANPQDGFLHAFQKGGDFICVGMFDWQIRDDVAMVRDLLTTRFERERPWV